MSARPSKDARSPTACRSGPELIVTHWGGGYSFAYGINSTGQVVGYSEATSFQVHAFLWTPTVNNGTTGTILDLGALGGGYSYAYGINDAGHVEVTPAGLCSA